MLSNQSAGFPLGDCPSWCVVDHDANNPDDLFHDSAEARIPSVMVVQTHSGTQLQSAELSIITSRKGTDSEPEVTIGYLDGTGPMLHLTTESAQRLATALSEHLRTIQRPNP